ncbi:hypothetical protein ACLKA7_011039 [Drosophila subpalustris]
MEPAMRFYAMPAADLKLNIKDSRLETFSRGLRCNSFNFTAGGQISIFPSIRVACQSYAAWYTAKKTKQHLKYKLAVGI